MWKKVGNYSLNFHYQPRRAAAHLKLEDGSGVVMHHLTMEELHALGHLLREETKTCREEYQWQTEV